MPFDLNIIEEKFCVVKKTKTGDFKGQLLKLGKLLHTSKNAEIV